TGTLGMQHATVIAAIIATTVIAGIIVVVLFGEALESLVESVIGIVTVKHAPMVVRRWRELHQSLAVMRRPSIAVPATLGALLVWGLRVVLQWTVIQAFQPAGGMLDAAFFVGVVSIASAVPAAPGAIGAYQLVAQQALVLPFPALYTMSSALA